MSDSGFATSLTLLEKAQSNDREAWNRLVAIYSPLVFHWCVTGSRLTKEDASDVVQDVFLAVSKSLTRFRHDRDGDTFRGWLRIITQNKIRNFVRQQKKHPRPRGGSTANLRLMNSPDIELPDDEAQEVGIIMRHAVTVLKEHFNESTYRAFWMFSVDGIGTDVIGEQLGLSPQAVRQACYRVRRRLKVELGELLG